MVSVCKQNPVGGAFTRGSIINYAVELDGSNGDFPLIRIDLSVSALKCTTSGGSHLTE